MNLRKIPLVIFILLFSSVVVFPLPFQTVSLCVPETVNRNGLYLFFLHGRIVEDRGIRPTSETYGVYEYEKILETFQNKGFTVISESRPKNTNVWTYADQITGQIEILLDAGVPAQNITVAGASKGGAIAIVVSAKLQNKDLNYALIAACEETMVASLVDRGLFLTGSVLSIFDTGDEFLTSCQVYFKESLAQGLGDFQEIALDLGRGHGFHYTPVKEWVEPVIDWAKRHGAERRYP